MEFRLVPNQVVSVQLFQLTNNLVLCVAVYRLEVLFSGITVQLFIHLCEVCEIPYQSFKINYKFYFKKHFLFEKFSYAD